MTTALLIGGTGFAGFHMQQLLSSEYKVVATGQAADITKPDTMYDLIQGSAPDFVVNFASVTTVKESIDDPYQTYKVGFIGTLNVLQALKQNNFKGRMLNISSSEVYGFPSQDELPVQETARLKPMSPYSVSKAATEALCYQWSQTERFEIVTARPFTHIGPGQSSKFAISNFTKQIVEILLHKREPVVQVGDLQTTRDLTDVRDVVVAYKMLMEKGHNGEVYNICSGKEVSMQSVLNQLIDLAGLSIVIKQDERLLRKSEQRRTCGCLVKIKKQTGWSPVVPLRDTLQDTLSYWKRRMAARMD